MMGAVLLQISLAVINIPGLFMGNTVSAVAFGWACALTFVTWIDVRGAA